MVAGLLAGFLLGTIFGVILMSAIQYGADSEERG